jgi:GNAT superfamily N-acetyltransferase
MVDVHHNSRRGARPFKLRVEGIDRGTNMLMCSEDGEDVGWCQWYLWEDYQEESLARDARDGEVGIDFAIGRPTNTGRGLGTRLVATLVEHVRRIHPRAGILADPKKRTNRQDEFLRRMAFRLLRCAELLARS